MTRIEYSTDNAAFEEGSPINEHLRILERVREGIAHGRTDGVVNDSNGNAIGRWTL